MLPFEDARTNFVTAARQGLGRPADVARRHGATRPRALALDVLLPLAAEGLESVGVAERGPHAATSA